jgi:NAD(P)-dependent dehydrogenase (short-subunit alcohol dehydrogenase family)
MTWGRLKVDGRISYFRCDLSDEKEIAALCDTIKSEIGHPTVLSQL